MFPLPLKRFLLLAAARNDGTYASKIETIKELQAAGYFVLLFFVGLGDVGISVGRVRTARKWAVTTYTGKSSKSVSLAPSKRLPPPLPIADAAILADNSRDMKHAFTVVRVQAGKEVLFDIRATSTPQIIRAWMDIVCGPHVPASDAH